eukprot:128734_1
MRVTLQSIPSLLLIALPIITSYFKFGIITTLIISLIWCAFKFFVFSNNVQSKPKIMKLESILISHYAEKVRWCMEYCNIPFKEEFDSAIFGILFFGRSIPTLYDLQHRTIIGNSSNILRYLYGLYSAENEKLESFLKPTVESLKMETILDEKLGRSIQKIFYYQLSIDPCIKQTMLIAWGAQSKLIPFYQQWLVHLLFRFYVKALTKFLNLSRETYEQSILDIKEIFALVESKLKTNKYIMGDKLTYIDITFCSLAAHLIIGPDTFANGLVRDAWPDMENNVAMRKNELYKHIETFRNMKAAEYVRDIYKKHR